MKKRNYTKKFILGSILCAIVFVFFLIGLIHTPYDPNEMNNSMKFAKVSASHIMGCDNFGRDIFSRVLCGLRTTLLISAVTVLIGLFFGILVGSLCGYYGGAVDLILMRTNDAILAFPSILLALVVVSVIGSGKYPLMITMGVLFIPSFARIVRGEFLRCRNLDYVKSAKLMGASDLRIMFVHILPNTLSVIASSTIIGFNNAVIYEAGMSFLGLGVQPPDSSLGRMLSESQAFFFIKPSYAMFSGGMIVIMILGFALLGDGIKEMQ